MSSSESGLWESGAYYKGLMRKSETTITCQIKISKLGQGLVFSNMCCPYLDAQSILALFNSSCTVFFSYIRISMGCFQFNFLTNWLNVSSITQPLPPSAVHNILFFKLLIRILNYWRKIIFDQINIKSL